LLLFVPIDRSRSVSFADSTIHFNLGVTQVDCTRSGERLRQRQIIF
jgi:hypothetical protein